MPSWAWPWIVVAAVGLLWLLRVLIRRGRQAFARTVKGEMVAFLREGRPDLRVAEESPIHLLLRGAGDVQARVALDDLVADAAKAGEGRRAVYQGWLDAFEEGQALMTPTLERHGELLLPQLIDQTLRDGFPDDVGLVTRPLAGTPLFVSYVVDGKSSRLAIGSTQLASLGIDAAALDARALENLRKKGAAAVIEGLAQVRAEGLAVINTNDTFDAARLLLVPEHLGPDEEIAALVPGRDVLALSPVPKDGNWQPLRSLIQHKGLGTVLLPAPLRVSKAGFRVV